MLKNIIYAMCIIAWSFLLVSRFTKKKIISEGKQLIIAIIFMGIILAIDIIKLIS